MKIRLLLTVMITMLFATHFYGQTPTPTGWERIHIKNLGYFDLPPTMEVQKGKYKEVIDEIKKIAGYDATQLTAQQKGLSKLNDGAFQKYARVIIESIFGSAGDFEKLNFNPGEYSQADIREIDKIYKEQTQQSFYGTPLKLIEWYPLKIEKINGMTCIHASYKRQLKNNPLVLVHIYIFHNNDRMHNLTLSYRLSEKEYWKSDFEKIIKSFRITNVR